MLVLTRKVGQKINIGDDITVTVVSIDGRYVRVGVEAPGITVLREEVLNRKPETCGGNER